MNPVSGFAAVLPVTHLVHLDTQLLMYVVPLLNPVPGRKLIGRSAGTCVAEMAPLRFQFTPEFQQPHEVGLFIPVGMVRLVRRLLFVHGPIARIPECLNAAAITDKSSSRHSHGGSQQHAGDPRIHRQAGQLMSQTGDVPLAINRTDHSFQHPVAVPIRRLSGGSRNGNFDISPKPSIRICRMTRRDWCAESPAR